MIGVFDSGIGGLTVVRALKRRLPGYGIVYFGDTARTPYGTKSPQTVIQYAVEDAQFLVEKGAQFLVVGCNTASSLATDTLRDRFDVPIFEVISPAVQSVASWPHAKRIGIIGTRATINSMVYQKKIKAARSGARVFGVPCPLLVPLVEEGWLKKSETRKIVKKYLHPLKVKQIDMLILGCTHYPLLKDIIQAKIGKRVTVIDSSETLAVSVEDFLNSHPEVQKKLKKDGKNRFFVSDVTEHTQRLACSILRSADRMELMKIPQGTLTLMKS